MDLFFSLKYLQEVAGLPQFLTNIQTLEMKLQLERGRQTQAIQTLPLMTD
jgi:hypothetical protein